MITRQQLRDAGQREITREVNTRLPHLSRRERRKMANAAHRTAWRKSKQKNVDVIAEIVARQAKDNEKAYQVIEAIG